MKKSKKLVYGVGINDANYAVKPIIDGMQRTCPYYQKWTGMLNRCYSKSTHNKRPNYISCYVTKEWHYFMNFRAWMEKQDWEGKQLDKDIIVFNNKMYGPETCVFVSAQVNSLLNDREKSRGEYPQGVYPNRTGERFTATCSVDGKSKYLGTYSTIEEASDIYREFKSKLVMEIANKQTSSQVRSGLIKYTNTIQGVRKNGLD